MARIIRSEELGALQEVTALVAAQKARVENLEEQCRAAYEEAKREGFEAGRRDGLELVGAHLGDALGKAERELRDFDTRISAVVFQALGMILGDIEPTERYRMMIGHALKCSAASLDAIIKVPVEDEATVTAALRDSHPNIKILTDKYMAPGEIVLEAGGLRSHIGLVDQLSRLLEAIDRG